MKPLLLFLLLIVMSLPARAAPVDEDPSEPRVRDLAVLLRCPVCQSENILDSHSTTAREMVVILRERIAEGMSDAEIFEFFRTRYGDYVLLSPPLSGPGRIIWLMPVGLILLGLGLFAVILIRHKRRAERQQEAGSISTPLDSTGLKELEL